MRCNKGKDTIFLYASNSRKIYFLELINIKLYVVYCLKREIKIWIMLSLIKGLKILKSENQ